MFSMFQKIVIAVAVFTGTLSLALANGGGFVPSSASCCHVSNAYLGVAISRDLGNLDFERTDMVSPETNETNVSMRGIDGQLFGGYGWLFRDFYYLGIEGFGSITSNKGRVNGPVKADQNWDAGISLIPGIKITDSTLLYARVGWVVSRFNLLQGTGGAIFNENIRNGVQAGLGLATMLTNNIGIRGEWVWSRYQMLTIDRIDEINPNLFVHDDVRPIIDQLKFGVFYNFNMA